MKRALGIGITVWLLLVMGQSAQARPHEGWSAMAGFASFTSRGEYTDDLLDGETFEVTTSGFSLGADYQFALTERLSLNPIFLTSTETPSSDDLDLKSAGHGALGVQVRYWWDAWFAGGQLSINSETLTPEDSDVDPLTGSGVGVGLVGGYQSEAGWFVVVNTEGYSLSYDDPAADVSVGGIRIQGGYRWILDQDASSKTEVK